MDKMIDIIVKEPLLLMAIACLACGLFILFAIILCMIRKPDENNCYKNYYEGFFKRNLK